MTRTENKFNSTIYDECTFEEVDRIAGCSARSVFATWSETIDKSEKKKESILLYYNRLANYVETAMGDEYLANLYLITLGGRMEKASLQTMLDKMERVRTLILATRKVQESDGIAQKEITQYLYDPQPVIKFCFMLRISIINRLAVLLSEKLATLNRGSEKSITSEEENFCISPKKFMARLTPLFEQEH